MSEFITNNKKRIAAVGAVVGSLGVAGAATAPDVLAATKYETNAIAMNDGKERPNIGFYFKAGTKIYRSPKATAGVEGRVPEGTKLHVDPGPIQTDAEGNRYVGFSENPHKVHDIDSAAEEEMWVRTADGRRLHNPGPADIRLNVHDNGHITSPDESPVNGYAYVTVDPPRHTGQ